MSDINKRLEVLEETMAKMQEVIDDIRREAKGDPNKITVGDVVRNKRTEVRFVVTRINNIMVEGIDNISIEGINKFGATRSCWLNEVVKTGEHIYPVEEVLALMKEGEDE